MKSEDEENLYQLISISDVAADSPVLFIPHAATSKDVLVAHLGILTWKNQILLTGSPGTIDFERNSPRNGEEGAYRFDCWFFVNAVPGKRGVIAVGID